MGAYFAVETPVTSCLHADGRESGQFVPWEWEHDNGKDKEKHM